MKADRRRRQAGYTLVELLIATAIGAMIMAALGSVVVTTSLGTNIATSRVEASSQIRNFQFTAYDDMTLSQAPSPSGCGAPGSPCTTQAMLLSGTRMPNGSPTGVAYSVTYMWDPVTRVVTRQGDGFTRTVASNVTAFSWYIDGGGAHPAIVVALTVTVATYNATYSQTQSLRFYPRVTAP